MSDLPKIKETREAFSVWTNSDLTEGRGFQYPVAHCWTESTARRLAAGCGVQGSDGEVIPFTAIKVDRGWLGPVRIQTPSQGDLERENQLREYQEAVAKARASGLSEEEIQRIAQGPQPRR